MCGEELACQIPIGLRGVPTTTSQSVSLHYQEYSAPDSYHPNWLNLTNPTNLCQFLEKMNEDSLQGLGTSDPALTRLWGCGMNRHTCWVFLLAAVTHIDQVSCLCCLPDLAEGSTAL